MVACAAVPDVAVFFTEPATGPFKTVGRASSSLSGTSRLLLELPHTRPGSRLQVTSQLWEMTWSASPLELGGRTPPLRQADHRSLETAPVYTAHVDPMRRLPDGHAAPTSVLKHSWTIMSSLRFGLRNSLTGLPYRKTMTRSQRCARSSYSTLEIRMAPPDSAKSRMRPKICLRAPTSTPWVGSCKSRTSGST